MQDYNDAIGLNPADAGVLTCRAKLKYRLGDEVGAMEDYNLALTIDPLSSEALANRAILRGENGDHEGAVYDYDRAIDLKPLFLPGLYFNRGLEKKLLRNSREALEDIRMAKKLGSLEAMEYLSKR
jgi:tetratricopeptide (TPR) repeat protein